MTSLLDSTAHFSERCTRLGLTPAFVAALGTAGVNCLSRLAFAVGQPGQPIQNAEVDAFLQRALGRAGTLAESSSLKRLTFEAHTYLVATLRQQVDHTEDTQPRKVAYAERTQRMEALRADLRGVDQLQRSLQLIQVQLDTIQALLQQHFAAPPSVSPAVSAVDPAVITEDGDDIHFVFDLDPDQSELAADQKHWKQVVTNLDVMTWSEQQDARLDTAIKRWYDVVLRFPPGVVIRDQLSLLPNLADQLRAVRDIFSVKAPSTLIKRANSLQRYLGFLDNQGMNFPGTEEGLYRFFCLERETGCPASRLQAVVESIRFTEHVLGVCNLSQDLLSKRVVGASKFSAPGHRRQASPFTVSELVSLHTVLQDVNNEVWDRIMAGAALCAIYSRSRWGDLQHAEEMVADPDVWNPAFIEFTVREHKTKRAGAWAEGYLPAVALAQGVTADNWGSAWFAVRSQIGAEVSQGFPIMPAPNADGQPTKRPLTTSEAGNWIQLLLERMGHSLDGRRITSHSCKSTTLSYAAKYGLDISVRELLGGHVSHYKSVLCYSRDGLAEPLRQLAWVLQSIREQWFFPDASRSGRFVSWCKAETEGALEEVTDGVATKPSHNVPSEGDRQHTNAGSLKPVGVGPQVECVDSDSSDEGCGDTDSSSDEEACSSGRVARLVRAPSAPAGTSLVQHQKSRMLHLFEDGYSVVFMCGSPQNQVSDVEIGKLAESLYRNPTLGDIATVRRLHFEACTYLLNDMKTNAANSDASEPVKKLPFIEKQTRLDAQKRRITGLLHKPDQQPAHSLIDLAFHIVETGALTYIGPSKCHSRDMEIQAESKQKSKQIITLEQGSLRSSTASSMQDVDTSTELRLFFALQRRHLAFELVGLLSWEPCQIWLDKLMGSLLHEHAHQGPSLNLSQILRADREIFNLMAAEFSGSLAAEAGKDPPLDALFTRLMHDPRVNVHLIAMPKPPAVPSNPSPKVPKRELDHVGGKGGTPKRPRTGDKEPAKIPEELKGLRLKTSEGKPMCWHFNLAKSCNNPALHMSNSAFDVDDKRQTSASFSHDVDATQHHDVGLVVEFFSGTCRLSKACRKLGLRALPIDKDPRRAERCVVGNYDLSDPQQYQTLVNVLHAERFSLVHAHCAPSCGTASRARGRKVKGVPLHKQPQPLRSDQQPDGLDNLTAAERQRVHAANLSYKATVDIVLMLVEWGVSVSIENPANSLFWKTSWVLELLSKVPQGHDTILDNCMHGGARDKASRFWSFNPLEPAVNMLQSLGLRCDGSHTHKSWRPTVVNGRISYPTKEEAAYPEVLCERLASIFLHWAKVRGLAAPTTLIEQLDEHSDAGKRQLFTHQPRSQALKPAISEFGFFIHAALPVCEGNVQAVTATMPKGTRPVSRFLHGGFSREAFLAQHGADSYIHVSLQSGCDFEELVLGVPRDPLQFLKAAVDLGHPRGHLVRIHANLEHAVKANMEWPDHRVCAHRAKVFKGWLQKACELKEQEASLHDSMPPHLRKILGKKKLLLWKHILFSLDYKDAKIIDEVISGFQLTGWANESGVFDRRVRSAGLTVDQLSGMALGLNAAVVGSLKSAPWTELDQKALDETRAEVEKGWLAESAKVDMKNHFVAKRFAISQKGKLRLIDDFSVCGVNSTVGLPEKLRVESVDQVVALVLSMMQRPDSHSRWPLVGRTFDLKSAYKQFGVSVAEMERLKIACKSGPNTVSFFDVLALPFGATASVVAFLRIAASLAYIGTCGLLICWSSFFDDYTSVSPLSLAENTRFYIESLLRLLGVEFAAEGEKAPEFSEVFKTLGLQFDLRKVKHGNFELGHTESRRKELLEVLGSLLADDAPAVRVKDLEKLHGRLVWFNTFIFGRTLKAAVSVVSKFARVDGPSVAVEGELRNALVVLQAELAKDEPVRVTPAVTDSWIIFTDGAYEPDGEIKASVGGLLVAPNGLVVECFGMELPPTLLAEFLENSKHPIYELEIFPTLIALKLWGERLKGAQVVFYLDNDAARSALVRADGSTVLSQCLLRQFVGMEKDLAILPWFSRVPSASNPADDASRLVFNVPWLIGVPRSKVLRGCDNSCKQDAAKTKDKQ
eukprot:s116_g30.t1